MRMQLAEPLAALLVALAPGYDAIVAASTASSKNVMPRVAALLDVMQLSDISKVVSADTFERPIYAGNAIQTVQSADSDQDRHRADLDLRRRAPVRARRHGADRAAVRQAAQRSRVSRSFKSESSPSRSAPN